jgi:hypothetical protein
MGEVHLPRATRLSTPSLGITSRLPLPRRATDHSSFQLPLSGSQIGESITAIIRNIFQLPLSGSLEALVLEAIRKAIAFNSLSRDHRLNVMLSIRR